MDETDIIVSGAGIAGLVAAAGLAQRGFRVCVLDPTRPGQSERAPGADLRSTAYLQPACTLLQRLGLWAALEPDAAPLHALQVIDTTGWPPVERARKLFHPGDLGADTFGWNIPNWRARATLAAHLATLPGVDLRLGTGFDSLLSRSSGVRVRTSDGARIAARLVVGADGRASAVRAAAGIGVRVRRYGQKAMSFAVGHDIAHEGVSTEIYNSGGAFTTVPLPDHDGHPASAIVWMQDGAAAQTNMALDQADLGAAATLRSMGVLGVMQVISPRNLWPVVTQTAGQLTARRVALIAEAAHVMPPIGAQGLNTSLHDVAALLDTLDMTDPGTPAGLDAYAQTRARDIQARASVIDTFNRICRSDSAPVQTLRLRGLQAVHGVAPLRRSVMRAGLGARSDQNT